MVERIKWVDIARGIGILMVVYWHSLKGVYNYIGFNKAVYDIQIDFFDSFCMAAFFMISGFFVRRWLERTPKVAIMQKIQLLFIPYLIWSFIQGTFMIVGHASSIQGIGIKALFRIPIIPLDQMWFVYDLFIVFILYYFLNRILPKKYVYGVSLLLGLVAPLFQVWQFYNIFHYILLFAIGDYVQNTFGLTWLEKKRTLFVSGVLFLVLFIVKINFMNGYLLGLAVAIVGSFLLLSISSKIHSKSLIVIGQMSMYIYILHFIFMSAVYIILAHLGIVNVVFDVFLSFVAGTFMPISIFRLMPKGNMRTIVFGR